MKRTFMTKELEYVNSKKLETISGLSNLSKSLMDNINECDPDDRKVHGQKRIDTICKKLKIPTVKLNVSERPQLHRDTTRGTLKQKTLGTYCHIGDRPISITIYNLTAKTQKIVSGKTFFHTLLHEVCHHIDCAKLGFASSPHTTGFYKRISYLASCFN